MKNHASAGIALACALYVPFASAHLSLEQGGTHMSRYGDAHANIKQGPCGQAGGTRGENVFTYQPGETITVAVHEYIAHPGYFRIAFDPDGDDAFVDPASVAPLNRECMDDPRDHCGTPDFYNNEAVLLDNLDPHDYGPAKTYSWEVELPDVTCDNCTLQVIQVMTDPPGIHAPYDPSAPDADDIYYQCIDLVLQGDGNPAPSDAGAGSANNGAGGDSGGCSIRNTPVNGSTPSAVGIAALALFAAARRRSK